MLSEYSHNQSGVSRVLCRHVTIPVLGGNGIEGQDLKVDFELHL